MRKLLLQVVVIFMCAAAVIILLRNMGRGHYADHIVRAIEVLTGMSWYDAGNFYFDYIVQYLDIIVAAAVMVLFFILFRILLSWFTRYFDQMVSGVDQLALETDEQIVLSPELGFMQDKLNEVKHELKRRDEAAKTAEQRKDDLVIYLAHDIKTPLTSVIGYLDLMEDNEDMTTEQRAKYVGIALDKAYRLESLVDELFEITRYNYQSTPLKIEDVDLATMMVQVSDELYPQLSQNGNDVRLEVEEDLTVPGDREKLARVFNNILKNAASYSDSGTTVVISTEKTDDLARVVFRNAGEIPHEKIGHIFEKFYRVDPARSTATGGAGLGLAIAYDIVKLHGGNITASSGDGHTEFVVELPRRTS